MDLLDPGVPAEVGPLLGAAVHQPEEAALDERPEALLEERAEMRVGGVGLVDHHPVLDEQLVERVHRPDRGDVAGAEHEDHAARPLRRVVGDRLGLRHLRRRDAGLHPDLGADAAVEEPVPDVERDDAGDGAAVGPGPHPARDARPAVALDLRERPGEEPQIAQHEQRPHEPLDAGRGRARREPGGRRGGGGPALRHRQEAAAQLFEEGPPLGDAYLRPVGLLGLDVGDGAVERLARRGSGDRGRGRSGAGRGNGHERGLASARRYQRSAAAAGKSPKA